MTDRRPTYDLPLMTQDSFLGWALILCDESQVRQFGTQQAQHEFGLRWHEVPG